MRGDGLLNHPTDPEANMGSFQAGWSADDIDLDWELFNGLLEKESTGIDSDVVDAFMNDAELWNAFELQFNAVAPPQYDKTTAPLTPFSHKVRKVIGGTALGVCTFAFTSAAILTVSDTQSANTSSASVEQPTTSDSTSTIDVLSPTTSTTTTTTTEILQPTPIEFTAQAGDTIGTLKIPAICIDDIQVIQYSEQESDLVGNGTATLDRKIMDPTPSSRDCERIDEQPEDYVSRAERVRASAVTAENPEGLVSSLLPIAGFMASEEGLPVSPYPGSPGNTVIAAHGSTYSAGFADLGALQPGDQAIFERSDKRIYTYHYVGYEVLQADDLSPFLNYSHPDNPSTLTTYMCSDENGKTGSSARRYTVRWVLDSITQK